MDADHNTFLNSGYRDHLLINFVLVFYNFEDCASNRVKDYKTTVTFALVIKCAALHAPIRMLLVEVWHSFTGRISLETLLLRLLVLEELGSLG